MNVLQAICKHFPQWEPTTAELDYLQRFEYGDRFNRALSEMQRTTRGNWAKPDLRRLSRLYEPPREIPAFTPNNDAERERDAINAAWNNATDDDLDKWRREVAARLPQRARDALLDAPIRSPKVKLAVRDYLLYEARKETRHG